MKKIDKLLWALIGAEVTCVIGAIYSYGKVRYYQGRVDALDDLKKAFEKVEDELEKKDVVKEEAE